METDAYKQYKEHCDETCCYGWDANKGCLRVATLFEYDLGGIETAVPLMRKNMDIPKFLSQVTAWAGPQTSRLAVVDASTQMMMARLLRPSNIYTGWTMRHKKGSSKP